MTDKVKQMAPVIWAEIQKANNILLHCHRDPDGDSLGSSLAMMFALKNLSKKVTIIAGDSEKPSFLSSLPGFAEIKQLDYFQTNPEQFDLFLILDSNKVDRVSKKDKIAFPECMQTVIIDHHDDSEMFAKINLVDSSYPATSQILFDLFSLWQVEIDKHMALCLYIGIYTDTGGFKYSPVSSDSLFAAGELAKINPNFPKILFEMENSNDAGYLKYMGLALSSIETYFSNNVALSAVPNSSLREKQLSLNSISKAEIANLLKSVVGWNIAISFIEVEPNVIGLSLRTRDKEKFDISKIAKELGGGGHAVAAGATIRMPYGEAKKFLLETIQKVYPELGRP